MLFKRTGIESQDLKEQPSFATAIVGIRKPLGLGLLLILICSTAHAGIDFSQTSGYNLEKVKARDVANIGLYASMNKDFYERIQAKMADLRQRADLNGTMPTQEQIRTAGELMGKYELLKKAIWIADHHRGVGAVVYGGSRRATEEEIKEWRDGE